MIVSIPVYRTKDAQGQSSVDGVAITGTPTVYSEPWKGDENMGATVITTGTLTGTWTLWGTDKGVPDFTNDNDWVDQSSHPDFVEVNPAAGATKWRWQTILMRGGFFRLKYVNTSGTGTIYTYVTRCPD